MHRSASTTPTSLFSRSRSLARIRGGNFQRVDVGENVDADSNHQAVIAFHVPATLDGISAESLPQSGVLSRCIRRQASVIPRD